MRDDTRHSGDQGGVLGRERIRIFAKVMLLLSIAAALTMSVATLHPWLVLLMAITAYSFFGLGLLIIVILAATIAGIVLCQKKRYSRSAAYLVAAMLVDLLSLILWLYWLYMLVAVEGWGPA